jgi:hypothetical protein
MKYLNSKIDKRLTCIAFKTFMGMLSFGDKINLN